MIGGEGANNVKEIVYKFKKMKDKLFRVWIKNHNIEARFVSVKLFLVVNLVWTMLLFVTIILFTSNK